jgi:hypothetical protein
MAKNTSNSIKKKIEFKRISSFLIFTKFGFRSDPSAAKHGEGTKSGAGLSKSRETTGNRKWIGSSTGIHCNRYTENSES